MAENNFDFANSDSIRPELSNAYQYTTFTVIFIGVIANIVIIDTILHSNKLRTPIRQIVLIWCVSDLFYLFSAREFLAVLLKPLVYYLSLSKDFITDSMEVDPNCDYEHPTRIFMQLISVVLMWILLYSPAPESSSDTDIPPMCHRGQCYICILFILVLALNLVCILIPFDLTTNHISVLRYIYVGMLILLLVTNELQYFCQMCEDDEVMEEFRVLPAILPKINLVRIYVYNWCFVHVLHFAIEFSQYKDVNMDTTLGIRFVWMVTMCLTLTVYLTSLYACVYLLANDNDFRTAFMNTCRGCRGGNSINRDASELSSILSHDTRNRIYYSREFY